MGHIEHGRNKQIHHKAMTSATQECRTKPPSLPDQIKLARSRPKWTVSGAQQLNMVFSSACNMDTEIASFSIHGNRDQDQSFIRALDDPVEAQCKVIRSNVHGFQCGWSVTWTSALVWNKRKHAREGSPTHQTIPRSREISCPAPGGHPELTIWVKCQKQMDIVTNTGQKIWHGLCFRFRERTRSCV